MTSETAATAKKDIYQEVTNKILAQLEAGTVPWVKPWSTFASGSSFPQNAVTGRKYAGTNVILCWIEQQAKGYSTGRWLTFKQAREFGGHVRKGEKGTMITYWSSFEKTDKATGETKNIPYVKAFTVFNLDQCDGLPDALLHLKAFNKPKLSESERNEQLDRFIGATLIEIRYGSSRAAYHPREDYIESPAFESFHTSDAYYNTNLHELAHATGHEKRLNRDKTGNRFGNAGYAREELVAELASSFLCAEYGVDTTMQSAAYINSWIALLKDDNKAFMQAAAAAQKAADWLRACSKPVATEEGESDMAQAA